MNNDYLFLENLYQLLEQGYGIEETLLLCKEITHHHNADAINIKLKEGIDFKDAILECDFPKQFLEFFEFFAMQEGFNRQDDLSTYPDELSCHVLPLFYVCAFSAGQCLICLVFDSKKYSI